VICGIVATHGNLGRELIRTAERIAGPQQELVFISNEGLSVDAFTSFVKERLNQCTSATGVVIMTDVPGGSCTLACRRIRRDGGPAWIVTGVNLPMVLAFLQYRDSMEAEQLVKAVAERGAKAIEVVG
jgi:mannose/fructose-specific phosphotransferase system component IIA